MQPYSFSGVRVYIAPYLTTVTVAGKYTPETPSRIWGPPESCYEGSPEEIEITSAEVELVTPAGDGPAIDLMTLPEYLQVPKEFWQLLEEGLAAAMGGRARYAA